MLRWAALVVAAPLLWALWDLVVTGDPLWSLHGTQDFAEELERPRELGTAFGAVPAYLRDALGDPYLWLGLAGAAAGLCGASTSARCCRPRSPRRGCSASSRRGSPTCRS